MNILLEEWKDGWTAGQLDTMNDENEWAKEYGWMDNEGWVVNEKWMKRWVGDDGCVGNKGHMNVQIWEELDGHMDE